MSHKKIRLTLATALVSTLLVGAVWTGDAAAADAKNHVAASAHRVHGVRISRYRHYLARRRYRPIYAFVPSGAAIPPGAIVMPGYVYMPGRGILDEACNLPTSACSNLYRDTQ
ncbi:MAG TPA: hypothetical protein VEJ37_05670 [Xanthobacteraceae bacterium]|nr:hypothetical protein [Xanthobacteraceae bacterium]